MQDQAVYMSWAGRSSSDEGVNGQKEQRAYSWQITHLRNLFITSKLVNEKIPCENSHVLFTQSIIQFVFIIYENLIFIGLQ